MRLIINVAPTRISIPIIRHPPPVLQNRAVGERRWRSRIGRMGRGDGMNSRMPDDPAGGIEEPNKTGGATSSAHERESLLCRPPRSSASEQTLIGSGPPLAQRNLLILARNLASLSEFQPFQVQNALVLWDGLEKSGIARRARKGALKKSGTPSDESMGL
jgi:hypothetical protein